MPYAVSYQGGWRRHARFAEVRIIEAVTNEYGGLLMSD